MLRDAYQKALQAGQHAFKVLVHQDQLAPTLEFADSFGALQVQPMLYLSIRIRLLTLTRMHMVLRCRLLLPQVRIAEAVQHSCWVTAVR